MAHFWLCEIKLGRMIEHLESSAELDQECFSSKGADNEQRWLQVPAELHWSNVKVYEDLTDPDAPLYSLVEDSEKDSPEWDLLRAKRTLLLKDCDWTQLSDSPLAAEDKTDWASYRQYLRDIPQDQSDAEYEIMDFAAWLAAQ